MKGYSCFECGQPAHHRHHVVPEVLGGTQTVPLCESCHGKVHDRDFCRQGALIRAGIAANRAKMKPGEKWGSGRKPGQNVKTLPEVRQQVVAMKTQGRTIAEIARVLHLSRPTVYAVLAQEGQF
jgi:hypothetical protein